MSCYLQRICLSSGITAGQHLCLYSGNYGELLSSENLPIFCRHCGAAPLSIFLQLRRSCYLQRICPYSGVAVGQHLCIYSGNYGGAVIFREVPYILASLQGSTFVYILVTTEELLSSENLLIFWCHCGAANLSIFWQLRGSCYLPRICLYAGVTAGQHLCLYSGNYGGAIIFREFAYILASLGGSTFVYILVTTEELFLLSKLILTIF